MTPKQIRRHAAKAEAELMGRVLQRIQDQEDSMKDCIDRRTGSEFTFLCDDANQAFRRAHDEPSWMDAYHRAIAVVEHLNRGESRMKHGKLWAEQALGCLLAAAAARTSEQKGRTPCPASH